MKDAKTKKIQKQMEPDSHLGTAVFGATTVSGATALAITARKTAWGTALVNTTLPTLIDICAGVGALDVFVSLARLAVTHGARKRCKTTVKNIGKVQQITRVLKPASDADKDAVRLYNDYIGKLKGLDEVDDENLTPILRSIYIDNPNRLQQDVLNNLSFRDLTGEHAIKNDAGEVVFDGATLDENLDYGLSTVYNVIKLKALLEEAKASYKGKKKDEGVAVKLDKLVGAGTEAEKTKLLKQLGHIGITEDTILKIEEIGRIIGLIDVYLRPLDALKEDVGTGKDGLPKRALFLDAYRLRGKNYQNFGDMFKEGKVGYKILDKLLAAHAATMEDEDGEEFVRSMHEKADKVNSDIGELGLDDAQIINLRKKMKHNREYVLDFKLSKNQRALLTREYYLKRNKELNAHFKNGFVTLDWVKDVLTTGVEHNKGAIKKQYKLAIKICDLAGISKGKIKAAIKDGSIGTLLQKPELRKVVEDIAKGIDFGSLAGKGKFNTQYLITNNYKLKKYTKRRKALKKVYKSLPEYKKVAKRNQLLGLIKPLGKKIGFGTIAGLTLGAGLFGAALTGVGLPIAIALGAAGVGVMGVTAASRIHQAVTGKKFFRIKTDAYEDKAEYAEWKKQNPSKNFAPTRSVTTPRFRNNVVSMSEGKIKQWGKRFFNAIGWSNFGKPKADEIQFGVGGEGPDFEYPHSLISAYDVEGTLDGAREGISQAIKKSVARGLRHNSEVNFLVDPIEVYIRDKKGKVKAAVHIDQKNLAKDVLEVLLEQHGASADTTFDVNIGKTRFIVQPSEIIDKDSGAIDKTRLKATVKRITGYAREEEFRRTIPELYANVYRNPEAFGIELDEEGAVIGNHALASSVNFNATRFGDGEQLYKQFRFKPVTHERRGAHAGGSVDVDTEVDADVDADADRLRARGRGKGGVITGDEEDEDETDVRAGKKPKYNPKTLDEALYIWAHDPENMRKYQEARNYFDDYLRTIDTDGIVVDGDETDDKDLPDTAKELKEIANKLATLKTRVDELAKKDEVAADKDSIEDILSKLKEISDEIKPLITGDGKVDVKTLDAKKLEELNAKLTGLETSIAAIEAKIKVVPDGKDKKKGGDETPPPDTTDESIKDILAKIDALKAAVEALKTVKADDKGDRKTSLVDIDELVKKLLEAIGKEKSAGAGGDSKDKDAIKNSIKDARNKIISAVREMIFGDGIMLSGSNLWGLLTSISSKLPDDMADQIINGVLEGQKDLAKSKEISGLFNLIRKIQGTVNNTNEVVWGLHDALKLDVIGEDNMLEQILTAISSITPGEAVDYDRVEDIIRTVVERLEGKGLTEDEKKKVIGKLNLLLNTLLGEKDELTHKRTGGAIKEIQNSLTEIKTLSFLDGDTLEKEKLTAYLKDTIISGFEKDEDGHEVGWLGSILAELLGSVVATAKITEDDMDRIAEKVVAKLPEISTKLSDEDINKLVAELTRIGRRDLVERVKNPIKQVVRDARDKIIAEIQAGKIDKDALLSEIEALISKGLSEDDINKITEALIRAGRIDLVEKVKRPLKQAIHSARDQIIEAIKNKTIDTSSLVDEIKALMPKGLTEDDINKIVEALNLAGYADLAKQLKKSVIQSIHSARDQIIEAINNKTIDTSSLLDEIRRLIRNGLNADDVNLIMQALEAAGYKTLLNEIKEKVVETSEKVAELKRVLGEGFEDARVREVIAFVSTYEDKTGKTRKLTKSVYDRLVGQLREVYKLDDTQIAYVLNDYKIELATPKPPKKDITYEGAVKGFFSYIKKQSATETGSAGKSIRGKAIDKFSALIERAKQTCSRIDVSITRCKTETGKIDKVKDECLEEIALFREMVYGSGVDFSAPDAQKVYSDAKKAMIDELIKKIEDKSISIDDIVSDLKARLESLKVKTEKIDELFADDKDESSILAILEQDSSYDDATLKESAKQLAAEIAAINKYYKDNPSISR